MNNWSFTSYGSAKLNNRNFRYGCYRNSFYALLRETGGVNWNKKAQRIKSGERVPLPLCVVKRIKDMFPVDKDDSYTHFLYNTKDK